MILEISVYTSSNKLLLEVAGKIGKILNSNAWYRPLVKCLFNMESGMCLESDLLTDSLTPLTHTVVVVHGLSQVLPHQIQIDEFIAAVKEETGLEAHAV